MSKRIEDLDKNFKTAPVKTEAELTTTIPANRRQAELAVFHYIETFYNPARRHSSLGYLSPVAFENQSRLKHKTTV